MLLAIVKTFLNENMRENLTRVSFYGVDLDPLFRSFDATRRPLLR